MPKAMERLCDWVVNKDQVWVHGDRVTDGHVALDMRVIAGLDPKVVDRDGRWMIRKSNFPTWLGEDHPDLTDALPPDGPGWNQITWSNWSTGGARIGATAGLAVAVNHAWLSRLQSGYRIEHSPDHAVLRIVQEEPTPGLLTGPEPHHAVVGAVVPLRPKRQPRCAPGHRRRPQPVVAGAFHPGRRADVTLQRAQSAGAAQAGGMEPRVVVEPQARDGGRRVRVGAEILGIAYGPGDLLEFLRRAGAVDDVDQVDLAATDWIDWHGGGPGAWPQPGPDLDQS